MSVAFAQNNGISGQVIDKSSRMPLQQITVLLKDSVNKIIGYKSSDATGHFNIVTAKNLDGAYLEVNHLGYKRRKIEAIRLNQPIQVELEVSAILLEDVEIKSKPRIQRIGDTLAYD